MAAVDLETMLKAMQDRLSALSQDKAAIQKEIQGVEAQLQEGYSMQRQRPRESEADIEKQLKDLEKERTTRSMPLAEEKKLLRKMDQLKKVKASAKAYRTVDEDVQGLKKQKSSLFDALKSKDAALAELQQGIRRVQLALRVGVSPDQLTTVLVEIPEHAVARVIGKGGANLKKIEETCKVSIDLENGKNQARISGSAASCALAQQRIEEVTQAVLEEVAVSEALAQTLVVQKGAMIHALTTQFNVRMDVAKDEGLLRLQGLPTNVARARAHLQELEASVVRRSLPVERRLIAAVLGKGGENFRRIEQEYQVSIDVDRDAASSSATTSSYSSQQKGKKPSSSSSSAAAARGGSKREGEAGDKEGVKGGGSGTIYVAGLAEKVAGAVAELEKLVEMLEDKEERVPVDKFAGWLLMEAQGKAIKELRQATGCLLFLDLKKGDEAGAVCVRGPAFKLADGVAAVRATLAAFEAQTETLDVGPEMVKYVIGKKGAVINKLREATGAVIETDPATGRLRVYASEAGARLRAKEEVQKVLDRNQASEVELGREPAIALKGAKGQELRAKAADELGVHLDIDGDAGLVKLRGSAEAMAAVRAELLAFAEENHGVEVDLPPEDYMALVAVAGGEGGTSLRKQVQDATGATLIPLKDEGVLKIRGPKAAVAAAEAAVRQALDGDAAANDGTVATVPCHPDAVPALIGKSGAGINKFREEHGVSVVVLKVRRQIRVRGDAPGKVAAAEAALRRYLAELRVVAPVPASAMAMNGLEARGELAAFRAQYDVNVDKVKEGYRVRGLAAEVAEAKARLTELVTGRARAVVEVGPEALAAVGGGGGGAAGAEGGNWKRIREDFAVSVDVGDAAGGPGTVVLQGAAAAVHRAKAFLFQMLEVLCPGQFAQVPVPVRAMPALASPIALAELQAATGIASLWLDREQGLARVRGPPEAVAKAPAALEARVAAWRATHADVAYDGWMLPLLIGKAGARIKELEAATGTSADVDRDQGVIRLSAPGLTGAEAAAAVAAARARLEGEVATIRSEYAEVEVPPEAVASFIGKKGANLARLREETGCTIDVLGSNSSSNSNVNGGGGGGRGGESKPGSVRLRGGQEALAKAKAAIEAFVAEWRKANVAREVPVHPEAIRVIVGPKGATIRAISEASGARLDVDREKAVVVVRGTEAAVQQAAEAVQRIVDEDEAAHSGRRAEREAALAAAAEAEKERQREKELQQDASTSTSSVISSATGPVPNNRGGGDWSFPTVPPGADPAMARQLLERHEAAQQKGGKGKKKKAASSGSGGSSSDAAAAVAGKVVAAALASSAPSSSSLPPPPGLAAPAATNGSSVPAAAAKSFKAKGKPAAVAAATMNGGSSNAASQRAVAEVVQTAKASALLDLVLGGSSSNSSTAVPVPAAAPATAAPPTAALDGLRLDDAATAAAPAPAPASASYFKSASGLSIRL